MQVWQWCLKVSCRRYRQLLAGWIKRTQVAAILHDAKFSNDDQIPYLEGLSPRCNQLLRKLVACNPKDRLSALQGAVCSLVLLYGPKETEVTSLDDCHRWLFAETLELHLRPVLKGYENVDLADAKSKLRYIYLTVADPKHIWEACKLFHQV